MKTNLLAFLLVFLSFQFLSAEIVRYKELEKGKIWRGGQPKTEDDYLMLKKQGIKTIVNLRWDESVETSKQMARKHGFKFINVPMKATDQPDEKNVNKVLNALRNPNNQPVFLHCQHGKDRTGLISALYRVEFQNWYASQAREEWISMGFAVRFLRKLDQYFLDRTN